LPNIVHSQALVASKRSREAQTLEKLNQFKRNLGAFLTSVQPLPKVPDAESDHSCRHAPLLPTSNLTENGLEKGFLTETLDDYDDRCGLSSLILHFLLGKTDRLLCSGWRENTLVFTKLPRKEAPNYDNHYMVLDPIRDHKEGKRNSAKLSKWEKGGPLL
jgi:hypothetical protein